MIEFKYEKNGNIDNECVCHGSTDVICEELINMTNHILKEITDNADEYNTISARYINVLTERLKDDSEAAKRNQLLNEINRCQEMGWSLSSISRVFGLSYQTLLKVYKKDASVKIKTIDKMLDRIYANKHNWRCP